nr:tRNA lysidine(34) synthetase TilS [Acetobacter garciniae]
MFAGRPVFSGQPVDPLWFAARMAELGPFGPDDPALPPIALAVSGGGDSLALAWLARQWRANLLALVVDHGLRADSAQEADLTHDRLSRMGMAARVLRLTDLARGAGMAARARQARYRALLQACRAEGCVNLLLGHQADDQAETAFMRQRAGSGPDGLAAMGWVSIRDGVRLVRPLLGVSRLALRNTLREAGLAWVDDPSNEDRRAERVRVRQALAMPDPTGPLSDQPEGEAVPMPDTASPTVSGGRRNEAVREGSPAAPDGKPGHDAMAAVTHSRAGTPPALPSHAGAGPGAFASGPTSPRAYFWALSMRAGAARMAREAARAQDLARQVALLPQGWARLGPALPGPDIMQALIRCVGGLAYPPPPAGVARLCAGGREATLAGVRLLRWREDWMLVREQAAMAPPVPAFDRAVWDNRFMLVLPPAWNGRTPQVPPAIPTPHSGVGERALPPPVLDVGVHGPAGDGILHGLWVGAAGYGLPRALRAGWPAAFCATLPALWWSGRLVGIPALGWAEEGWEGARLFFQPPAAVTGGGLYGCRESEPAHYVCPAY